MNTFGCMKIQSYIDTYEELFQPLRRHPVTILELGVLSGASLLMWNEYFSYPGSEIIGLDMSPPIDFRLAEQDTSKIFQYQGQQDDFYLLESIIAKHGPFDIIIDDASHRRQPTETSLAYLRDALKPGGYYVIEDWGTGYWAPERGFDGEHYQGPDTIHYAGMVGLIKDLVDDVASEDFPQEHSYESDWLSMEIRRGQAILRKKLS